MSRFAESTRNFIHEWSLNILILLSGLVIYLVARWVQRRRGVNLDAAYGEIPVE